MTSSILPPVEMKITGDLASNWDNFRAEFEDYSLALGLNDKPAEVQAATLRRVMGSECRHIYKHNLSITAEQEKDAEAILDALEEYFKPARNVIFERYVFGNCKQDESEPIDAFITRLREKAASCEYGELRDELIRDRVVLDVSETIEICRSAEMTDIRIKAMAPCRSLESVHATDGRRQRPTPRHERSDKLQNQTQATGDVNMYKYCGSMQRRGRIWQNLPPLWNSKSFC